MKKGNVVLAFLAFITLIVFVSSVSAEISISSPKPVYNVGDNLDVEVSLQSGVETRDFFVASFVCNNNSNEFYRVPYSLKVGEIRKIDLSAPMDNFLVGGLEGRCNIRVSFGEQSKESSSFELTSEIVVSIGASEIAYNPGESIFVSGDSVKKNGETVNGFVELIVLNKSLSSIYTVQSGKFNGSLLLPEDMAAGDYSLNVLVYEKDNSGSINNRGNLQKFFKVNQIVKKADLALNKNAFNLRDELIYTPLLYDQTNREVNDIVEVILSHQEQEFTRTRTNSGSAQSFVINESYSPGVWKINENYNSVKDENEFTISELVSASFIVQNGSLIVRNVGNVPYSKKLNVYIGDDVKEIEVPLIGIYGEKKYNLFAPDGEYDIKVEESGSFDTEVVGRTSLTGKAVRIEEDGKRTLVGGYWALIWGLVLLVFAFVGVYYYRKNAKLPYLAGTPKAVATVKSGKLTPWRGTPSQMNDENIAEGEKELCTIMSLKIKNHQEVLNSTSNAPETLDNAVSVARDFGGKAVHDGSGNWTVVFSPSIAGKQDIAFDAVKAAMDIERILGEHNDKFAQKIQFGIGLNQGELIVESNRGDFKFVSLGNSIPSARRIAEIANNSVLLSEGVHNKTLANVKTERVGDYWAIRRLVQRNQHSEFIENFMKRQGKVFNQKQEERKAGTFFQNNED